VPSNLKRRALIRQLNTSVDGMIAQRRAEIAATVR
jgi:hypothetical protein